MGKYEFKPDKPRAGILSKLYLTRMQRQRILRWFLYTVLLVALSVLQDVILCRFRFFGATTDLVPCGIFLICVLEGTHRSSVFVLVAACLYQFSGGPGYYCIALIVVLGIFAAYFRQSFLQQSFSAVLLCLTVALLLYEGSVFLAGFITASTTLSRLSLPLLTTLLTLLLCPLLYPLIRGISSIGGEIWKE